ncbi:MAG TPA: GatB/YqeY domain-containing protein [Aggregatilinea sp.]|uniref:GatB/YqeY domain-containing protein n=1 Tax=Aggregatilinea sp. TaxID=2806333 RepID=UPI002C692023|nr:GatB/YqeY domain-containing protein [Aggregatilinea sp.]HML22183.1 GatB/YqeY domain-containing protein [Aggregatilinea sp.]
MHPKEAVQENLKAAMKAGDTRRRETLRLMTAAFKQVEVDQRKDLTEDDATAILMSEAKKRRESIEEMTRAGRSDLAEQEQYELSVIEEFLPRQLSDDELRRVVREAIAETGASSPKDIGALMRVVMPRVQGQADGKRVNAIVRELLG